MRVIRIGARGGAAEQAAVSDREETVKATLAVERNSVRKKLSAKVERRRRNIGMFLQQTAAKEYTQHLSTLRRQ
jgi:hypothetical protein